MTQQGKPGWYPDGTGQQRWWDGRGWTGYTQPDPSDAAPQPSLEAITPPPAAPAKVAPAEVPAASAALPRRRGLPGIATAGLSGAALLIGLLFGGAIGSAANDNSAQTAKLSTTVTGLRSQLQSTTSERDTLKSAAADVAAQADQLDTRKTVLDDEATALSKRSDKLDTREKKLATREATVKRKAAALATSSESGSSNSSADSSSSSAPSGATAQCNDGTYSYSAHRSGTCSHHGGVATWL